MEGGVFNISSNLATQHGVHPFFLYPYAPDDVDFNTVKQECNVVLNAS